MSTLIMYINYTFNLRTTTLSASIKHIKTAQCDKKCFIIYLPSTLKYEFKHGVVFFPLLLLIKYIT